MTVGLEARELHEVLNDLATAHQSGSYHLKRDHARSQAAHKQAAKSKHAETKPQDPFWQDDILFPFRQMPQKA